MSKDAVPVLSIIVRRFHSDFKDDILQSLTELQRAAANQTGYLGHHNSLSEDDQYCELVNIFSFNSRGNLQEWENSDVRNSCLANLDQHPQTTTKHSQFNELAQILHPKTQIKKIEIVVILIFWILVLSALLGRVDKRDSHRAAGMIQTGIYNGDQLGTRSDVGRGMGVL